MRVFLSALILPAVCIVIGNWVYAATCSNNAAVSGLCAPPAGSSVCSGTTPGQCTGSMFNRNTGVGVTSNYFYCSQPGTQNDTFCDAYFIEGQLAQAECSRPFYCVVTYSVLPGEDPEDPANWILVCQPDFGWPAGPPTYEPLTGTFDCATYGLD